MPKKTFDVLNLINPDDTGKAIARFWYEWDSYRDPWKKDKQELRNYVYAVDTTTTTNAKLDWSNKTTIPKICQIRDNLIANYEATMFPKRKWLDWEAASHEDNDMLKQNNIKNYMFWNVEQPYFKEEVKKLIQDYIDYGNCFSTVEWVDNSVEVGGRIKPGFTGARPVRIHPLNIVFNPTASSFADTAKIIRSVMSIGEAKEFMTRLTKTEEERVIAEKVFSECMNNRSQVSTIPPGDFQELDEQYMVDGFGSYVSYLQSEYVELLTFYGDFYDKERDELLRNHMIVVMDRCKVIFKAPHPYPLAELPIWHSGWRVRQDNLWAMGPLDNLVGMQYRLDHIENMKADLFDLTTFPPLKIKGLVGEFEWGPMEKIFVDSDGDVELMTPQTNVVQVDLQIQRYEQMMEEMAGAPKEAMGQRSPGEKTAYEVQRLENAASRIFQNKIGQFEEQQIEKILNGMLVYAKQYLTPTSIRIVDNQYNTVDFATIRAADLSANGRLKPVAARHFAERAERIQNLNNFAASPLYGDPAISVHFSGLKMAKMMSEELDLEEWDIVQPFVRLSENAQATQQQNSYDESTMAQIDTPSGMTPDDFSDPANDALA
jgi:hypothetical protein